MESGLISNGDELVNRCQNDIICLKNSLELLKDEVMCVKPDKWSLSFYYMSAYDISLLYALGMYAIKDFKNNIYQPAFLLDQIFALIFKF